MAKKLNLQSLICTLLDNWDKSLNRHIKIRDGENIITKLYRLVAL